MVSDVRICSKCVSDTTMPGIRFDDEGVCNYCKTHVSLEEKFPTGSCGQSIINNIVDKIKNDGKEKPFDCIVGVSGGTDSSYCLYLSKKLGLRPLAVHFDNGWNTETSINNMNGIAKALNVNINRISMDIDEFLDIQRSFLKASVPDLEIPTDLAIHSSLLRTAKEHKIKWILNGMNFRTEGIQPLKWSYMDDKYVRSVHGEFGELPMRTYPNLTIGRMIDYSFVRGIRTIPLLAYLDASKKEMKETITRELGWKDYGGHHFESIYTRFAITDVLWDKFRIDKRKVQLSAEVRSGKITRQEALNKLKEPPVKDKVITEAVLRCLKLNDVDWAKIMSADHRSFVDYPTSYSYLKLMRLPIKMACKMDVIPQIFYDKYFGSNN